MLADMVIDTNVLSHCADPREARRAKCLELVEKVMAASTVLCVDEGFSLEEAANRSHICQEYLEHVRFGTPGYVLLTRLAANKRLKEMPRRADQKAARRINQLLRNRVDRTFLNIAVASTERIFVSHDFVDFSVDKRRTIFDELDVCVCEAGACVARWAGAA